MSEFVDIALNLPLNRLFTYSVPRALQGAVAPGVRVQVPFRGQRIGGTCVALRETAPDFAVRPIDRLLSEGPLFSPSMLRVCRWLARRYGATLGEALDAALPFAIRAGTKRRTVPVARLAVPAAEVPSHVEELERRHPKQARVLRILADCGGEVEARALMSRAKVGDSPLRSLARKKLLKVVQVVPDPSFSPANAPPRPEPERILTQAQSDALSAITTALGTGRHAAFLLFGVTGSGKTEVYLRALRAAVESGRQGIVLVPEIALTPQTVARFKARFPRVAVLHSNLTDAERHDHWRAIQRGEADVVIGARSAVFAPTPRLGLLVIDEEHESTFKQQNAPRYDAREVARARARMEGAVLVLGSATPSLESYHRARHRGRLRELRLSERVGGGRFPDVLVADLSQSVSAPGRRGAISDRLRAALLQHVSRGEQAILFLNRRGYATAAVCRTCGATQSCRECDIVLVYHRRIGRILCHYCGHERPLPRMCDQCRGTFRLLGHGTERIEEEVRGFLPDARVARMDSDTMRSRGAHEEVLAAFRRREIDVLVGTQMIAKGLDFPNVTLVGVISADTMLNLPDYRAAERTFNLLAQVSGRAGRAEKPGLVIVQTHVPKHPAIRSAVEHDYEGFAEGELRARQVDGYPPYGHLVRVVAEGRDETLVTRDLEALRDAAEETVSERGGTLLGPAPAPISMIQGRHRYHVVAKARCRNAIRAFVGCVTGLPRPPRDVRRLLDVDPLAML